MKTKHVGDHSHNKLEASTNTPRRYTLRRGGISKPCDQKYSMITAARQRTSTRSNRKRSRGRLSSWYLFSAAVLLYVANYDVPFLTSSVDAASSSYNRRFQNDNEEDDDNTRNDLYANDYCQRRFTKFDWERLNYYELLGLVGDDDAKARQRQISSLLRWNGWNSNKRGKNELVDTSNIDMKQIRKAYRRAAQLHHPDKATTGTGSKSTSIEESTARFAKIAEAYEVLSDPSKRTEYDTYLEHCYRHKKMMDEADADAGQISFKERFSNLFDSVVSIDPFAIFDDMFTGRQDDNFYSYENNHDDDKIYGYDSFSSKNSPFDPRDEKTSNQDDINDSNQRYSDPSRIYQHRESLFDPMTGEVIVRISQTEEYHQESPQASTSSSSVSAEEYYRIVSQDFKQRVDQHSGDVLLIPLTHPYIKEEGFRRGQHHDSPSDTPPDPPLESILHSWEVMTPNSRLLASPNGKYVAGLSPDCELLIMVDDDDVHEKDGVVWSSTHNGGGKSLSGSSHYGYNSKKNVNQCFAILKGSHLIIAQGGSVGHNHHVATGNDRILWYSDGEDDDSASGSGDGDYFDYEDEFGMWHRRPRSYLAQLDNDGSLTIYSVWSLPGPSGTSGTVSNNRGIVDTAKDLVHGRVRAVDYGHLYFPPPSSSHRPTGSPVVYKRCIYSTSPLGCRRLGRRLVQLSLEMYFRVKGFLARFNNAADAWLDLIYEEDDFLLAFKESIWKNGSAFGSRMASSSARFVRRVMEFFAERGV